MKAYYNEIDKYAAQWLRNLITAGHIAPGDVDERSIVDVRPDDLKGYTQCHFFAGIGGWSYALRLAGWDDARPVWTGSCPCQPFSSAGKQAAQSDERHLWPYWARLIAESKPSIIFGEQVAGAVAFGWWDDVAADLEAKDYAVAAAILPACSVGSPHRRNRLWFVANANCGYALSDRNSYQPSTEERAALQAQGQERERKAVFSSGLFNLQDAFAYSDTIGREGCAEESLQQNKIESLEFAGGFEGFNRGWDISAPQVCGVDDGVLRVPSKLRAYGNAIVPQVAAEFIRAAV